MLPPAASTYVIVSAAVVANTSMTTTTMRKTVKSLCLRGQTIRIRIPASFRLVLERAIRHIDLRARVAIIHLFRFPRCCRSRSRCSRGVRGGCRGNIGVFSHKQVIDS